MEPTSTLDKSGEFEAKSIIGTGTFGVVQLAMRKKDNLPVALKQLNKKQLIE